MSASAASSDLAEIADLLAIEADKLAIKADKLNDADTQYKLPEIARTAIAVQATAIEMAKAIRERSGIHDATALLKIAAQQFTDETSFVREKIKAIKPMAIDYLGKLYETNKQRAYESFWDFLTSFLSLASGTEERMKPLARLAESILDKFREKDNLYEEDVPFLQKQLIMLRDLMEAYSEKMVPCENIVYFAKLLASEVPKHLSPCPPCPEPECKVCMNLKPDTALGCGHMFCQACINSILQRVPSLCPMCRKKIIPIQSAVLKLYPSD
jgi:hypothetical protein